MLIDAYCPFQFFENIKNYIPSCYVSPKKGDLSFKWFLSSPKYTTFRCNDHKFSREAVLQTITEFLNKEAAAKNRELPDIFIHPALPDCIVVGPWKEVAGSTSNDIVGEVIVDVPCANAVLRGADIFAPGILGVFASAKCGDHVNIFADIDRKCLRGYLKKFEGKKLLIGHGILKVDRDSLFKENATVKGIGIEVVDNISSIPRFSLPREYGILQNLPSIVCGHMFREVEGTVLDMCAAPGNKTTHIATVLGNKGNVIALDKTANKTSKIEGICAEMDLRNVSCYVFDATKCVLDDCDYSSVNEAVGPPFRENTFPAILLDPPCSALGQRPALANRITLQQLKSYVPLQRKLFRTAVRALKPDGMLIYSTCTITMEENEEMVAWALSEFPNLSLENISPSIGSHGLPTANLQEEQRQKVQRFGILEPGSPVEDTIGFFIAKFRKKC